MSKITLHEKRKARIKISLLNITLAELKLHNFNEINVNTICEKAEVSKVTYFKYFPNKGDILIYFMTVWNYKLAVDTFEKSIEGKKAIEKVFTNVLGTDNYINVMIALIGFITTLKNKPEYCGLSYIEKQMLFPEKSEEIYNIEGISLEQYLRNHLKLSIELKEVSKNIEKCIDETVVYLLSIFYGVPLTLFTMNNDNLEKIYLKYVNQVLLHNQSTC